jgi:hypothetical protein
MLLPPSPSPKSTLNDVVFTVALTVYSTIRKTVKNKSTTQEEKAVKTKELAFAVNGLARTISTSYKPHFASIVRTYSESRKLNLTPSSTLLARNGSLACLTLSLLLLSNSHEIDSVFIAKQVTQWMSTIVEIIRRW